MLPARPPIPWVREELYFEGDAFYFALSMAIRGARHSVELESYIFLQDALGARLIDELLACAARGVRVRVLVDGWGSYGFRRRIQPLLERGGVGVRIFHPILWRTLNRRNHRKLCIIDGHTAFLGSRNVASVHCERYARDRSWRDTGARVEGVEVEAFARAFERSWQYSGNILGAPRDGWLESRGPGLPFRLNHSLSLRRGLRAETMQRFRSAHRRIWITNAYFVPDAVLLRGLRRAARRGVDVRLVVPGPGGSDIFFMPWVSAAFYRTLQLAGVRIYEYGGSVLHAKSMLVDDWCVVGSTNLNHRSLFHDLEADVVLSRPESVASLERQFLRDLEHSRPVSPRETRRPWYQRFFGRIGLLLRIFL